jgi:uncharacterized protein YqjF (DUF2071 family)
MLNYEVEPGLLTRYAPPGTTLDSFDGRTYVSLVGFRFFNTKIFGSFRVPFHADFLEVNLRFYVRRRVEGEDRRSVVFISEIVQVGHRGDGSPDVRRELPPPPDEKSD